MRQNSLRLARLLTMLPWLQSQGPVSVKEVARVFNISTKEVLADLALLTFVGPEQAGGGLVDIQYQDDLVRVIDSQGLETSVSLNTFEAISLVMGLKTLQDLDIANPATFSAIEKLERLQDGQFPFTDINLEINKSLSTAKLLKIEYLAFGASAAKHREIEPLQIRVENSALYLKAWCRSSGGLRDFRIDRILNAVCSEESFQRSTYLEEKQPEGHLVEITLKPKARWLLAEFSVKADQTPKNELQMKLKVFSSIWLFRFLVSAVNDIADFLVPNNMKKEIESELVNTIDRLKKSQ